MSKYTWDFKTDGPTYRFRNGVDKELCTNPEYELLCQISKMEEMISTVLSDTCEQWIHDVFNDVDPYDEVDEDD